MNKKVLDKYYDKLKPEERFKAMIAAMGRHDWSEYKKLGATAPQGKTYTVRNTHGLLEAWEILAMFHMLLQLGNLATFYFLMTQDEKLKAKLDEYPDTEDAEAKALQNIIENAHAWRTVCQEYGINPKDALSALPFIEFMDIGEIIAQLAGVMEKDNLKPDFESAENTYRDMINQVRAQWE